MFGNLIDKLVFGVALLVCLQVPLLVEHYQQFLAGKLDATVWQVDQYAENAKMHGYTDVLAMIKHHQENEDPSVREDAALKLDTLALMDELKAGVAILDQGHLLQKVYYMMQPQHLTDVEKTLENFTPGVPLDGEGLAFGAVVALLVNIIIVLPFVWLGRFLFKRPQPAASAIRGSRA